MHRVFMYGTLKRGQPNHYVLSEVGADSYRFVGKGYTSTKWPLVISSEHNIPYLLDKEGDGYNIKGEVYEIDDDLLAHIDQFECYPGIYGRRKIEIVMTSFEKDPNGASNTYSETDSKAHSKAELNADLKSDSKTDVKANYEVDLKADMTEDSNIHLTADLTEDSETNSKADSTADSKSNAEADLKAISKTDSTTADRLNQERTRMECWIYFLPKPISPSLLELERMDDYDSYGAHGKPYIPIYVQDKGWVGELEKPSS